MATSSSLTRITAATPSPPSVNRANSYDAKGAPGGRKSSATSILTTVASCTAAVVSSRSKPTDGSTASSSSSSSAAATITTAANTPVSQCHSPLPSPSSDRRHTDSQRVSWESCTQQRHGYVSFPDFDRLLAEREQGPSTQNPKSACQDRGGHGRYKAVTSDINCGQQS